MIGIILAVLYAAGVIVTATLLHLHIRDNPDWMVSEGSTNPAEDQLIGVGVASVFWPVTLIVYSTIAARRWWIHRRETP